MSKRGENIYKRKDGRWEGRYVKCRTLHGKIQYGYVYGKSYSETKAKLKENASAPIRSSSSQATQSALYDEVLKAWLLSSKNRVKESTFSRYNHLVERHIQPLLGRYPKPQRMDYRAGRKTEGAACTKGGGGSDTSSQSADEVYGDIDDRLSTSIGRIEQKILYAFFQSIGQL